MPHTRVYWLHALSPTHVGTGRGVGYIDLPVQRDKVTNWPMIPGYAFKGAWADSFGASKENRLSNPELGLAFGRASDEGQNNSSAGALISTDARLVCLPVRSFQGTFAWCSSALALRMLRRDLELAGMGQTKLPSDLGSPADGRIYLTDDTVLKEGDQVFLEDLDFIVESNAAGNSWAELIAGWVFPGDANAAWRTEFQKRFAVLPGTAFDFLTETGTEVTDRVRIDDDTKTMAAGQVWNEESLPAETILAGLVSCDRVYTPNAR
ncbi:MAG: type III-B CRISPR module RAMP protein Cmr4, partial [Thermoguttaceae bacterium]